MVNRDGATLTPLGGELSDNLVVDLSSLLDSSPSVAPARIEIRLLSLPTRRLLGTAHDSAPSPDRLLVVVGIESIDGVRGWGECSALNAPTYTHEWAEDSFDRLAAWAGGGAPPLPGQHPMAAAAIEMATIDAALRAADVSLAAAIGAKTTPVDAGATLGLAPVAPSVRQAQALVDLGYRKLKVKIAPGQVDDVPHALSHELEGIELHVDANGSLAESDLMALLGLTWHGVAAIEQPFPVDRPDLAAELILGTDAVVIADEAAPTVDDAEALRAASALRAVAVKPPRVGGIRPAIELVDWCRRAGIGASIGGMLESGLGRHSLAAIAGLDGFTVTGDLSPAGQWLDADPWPDLEMVDGSITIPEGPGVAPLPDVDALERFTRKRAGRSR